MQFRVRFVLEGVGVYSMLHRVRLPELLLFPSRNTVDTSKNLNNSNTFHTNIDILGINVNINH